MKLESLKCPECGAQLYFETDQEFCFCSHCGHQVYKEDVHFDKKAEIELEKLRITKTSSGYELTVVAVIMVSMLIALILMIALTR